MFLNDVPTRTRESVEIHFLHNDCLRCWREAKEGTLVRSTHSKTCSHLVLLGNHLLQCPLDIRKAPSHHPNNCKIASRTMYQFVLSRNMKYRLRSDELFSKLLTGSVDKLRKTVETCRKLKSILIFSTQLRARY